ncbi:unnamed protein product, partial [Didymodactylos carnosus]
MYEQQQSDGGSFNAQQQSQQQAFNRNVNSNNNPTFGNFVHTSESRQIPLSTGLLQTDSPHDWCTVARVNTHTSPVRILTTRFPNTQSTTSPSSSNDEYLVQPSQIQVIDQPQQQHPFVRTMSETSSIYEQLILTSEQQQRQEELLYQQQLEKYAQEEEHFRQMLEQYEEEGALQSFENLQQQTLQSVNDHAMTDNQPSPHNFYGISSKHFLQCLRFIKTDDYFQTVLAKQQQESQRQSENISPNTVNNNHKVREQHEDNRSEKSTQTNNLLSNKSQAQLKQSPPFVKDSEQLRKLPLQNPHRPNAKEQKPIETEKFQQHPSQVEPNKKALIPADNQATSVASKVPLVQIADRQQNKQRESGPDTGASIAAKTTPSNPAKSIQQPFIQNEKAPEKKEKQPPLERRTDKLANLSNTKIPLDSAQKILEQPPESEKRQRDMIESEAVESTSITTEKIELPSTQTEVVAGDRHHYEDTIAKTHADAAKIELPSTKTEVAAADRHHYEDTIAKPQADVAK